MTDSKKTDFEIVKQLGKGSFSSVYLVRRKEDQKIYALKSVNLQKLNKKEQQNSVNEVRILASVNHPNVIGYKEAFWDEKDNSLNIVMEYADDGDLQTKINKLRKAGGMFKENLIWSYSIQMIEGLKALHDKKIMHRDLKSANIFLVKDKYQCKIGDMNVSKVIKEKVLITQTGTPYYASPEVWRDEPYSYKSDLWSIGCVIYELCNLKPPFKGKDLDELFMNVCKGKPERISNVYSDDLWNMILMLLQTDVKKRCDCDKYLNSPLIVKKIKELKNENNNLEKNKEINDGNLLETIRFENIMDIKRQLPTKKNYSNTETILDKNNNKKKNIIKYRKINNKKKINKIPITTNANIRNSPKIKKDEDKDKENEGKSIIYQKPKLIENSVKREKKIFINNKPMTTKRTFRKINYIQNNITPKREKFENNLINNKNIYKNGYASVNREKNQKNINLAKPMETSPNSRNNEIYNNLIRKKNYSKKILDELRPQILLGINRTEIDLNIDKDNNQKKFVSNRENMVNMLKNNYNKKNINYNSYNNSNKEIIKDKKIKYSKIPIREKKLIYNNNDIKREMTEPELKMMNNKKKKEKEKMNLSLNEPKKEKIRKNEKYNTNFNKEILDKKINKEINQNNALLYNNYITINNLVNYPVRLIDPFP